METSDSDIESEYFESAEESLDEIEEKNEKNKSKKKLHKSESETTVPIGNTANSVCQVGNDSNNSLSYRKRPEKLKNLPSKTPVKPVSKSSTSEIISKSDKIVPDVFFQDITSNLSKNLNKSISTIQQTSSNVKDLILNSLPVSSIVNDEGFSYDDKNNLAVFDNDIELPEPKHEELHKITSIDNIVNVNDSSEIEAVTAEKHFSNKEELNISTSEKLELPDSICTTLEKENCNLENTIPNDILKNEVDVLEMDHVKESNPECLHSEQTNCTTKDSAEVEMNVPEKEEKNSLKTYSDCEETETFSGQHKTINEVAGNTESVNFIEKISECNTIENLDFSNSEEEQKSLEIESKNIFMPTEQNKVKSESVFNELKSALENIMKEEINCAESNNKSLENDSVEEVSCLEEKVNEGWDDFDFSDNEVERVEVSQQNSDKKLGKDSMENTNVKNDSEISSSRDSVLKDYSPNENPPVNQKSSEKFNYSQDNNKNLNIKEKNSGKIVTEVKESLESEDNWDWDSWDETPNDKNQRGVPSDKSINKSIENMEENNFDVSKWSGWDTFGQKPQEKQGTWGFGSWGVDVLLNKATAVTQGISSVLEAGLGAPDPETLARMNMEDKKAKRQVDVDDNHEYQAEMSKKNSLTNVNIFPVSGITNLVAGVTNKIVEHSKIQEIGSKVISGGLDTLETFGKKTMEVLQEGDPGLKNKRALLLGNNKPVLSQVLKEAREKASMEMKKAEEKEWARKCHFETLFDDFQGMVHLEALEMVSRQCELKLDQIKSEKNTEEQEHLNELLEEIEQLCSLDEGEIDMKSSVLDFKTSLQIAVKPLKKEISIEKLNKIHEDVSNWLQLSAQTKPSSTVIHQKLVSTLAELTAATVHQFHKGGELLSVAQCRMTLQEVDGLSSLTNILCKEINHLCEKFFILSSNGNLPESGENMNSVREKITEVMKNSTSYIKQAFDLLIPIIQLGAVSS